MKKNIIRGISMLLVLMTAAMCPLTAAATTEEPACQKQWSAEWRTVYYGEGENGGNLYDTGCGIFSFANAVYYLTGNNPDIETVSEWAASVNALNGTYGRGLVRGTFYANVEEAFGAQYGFTVPEPEGVWADWSSTDLREHLKNGEVAIAHVPGHFIAVVDYNEETNEFHVYDSAPSSGRGTNKNNGKLWLSEEQLVSRSKSKLDWYCKLKRTGAVPVWYEASSEASADLDKAAGGDASSTNEETGIFPKVNKVVLIAAGAGVLAAALATVGICVVVKKKKKKKRAEQIRSATPEARPKETQELCKK